MSLLTTRPAASRRSARQVLAATAVAIVVPALLLASPGVADAASTRNRADAAAGWLGRQLSPATGLSTGQFGPDYGLSADIVLALDSAGVGQAVAGRTTRALAANVGAYTGFGAPSDFFAGAFAKLINVAVAQRVNPRRFGTSSRRDLVGHLRYLECGRGNRPACPAADTGRFSDQSSFGDFSNTITQSLALVALHRATRPGPSSPSVGYLLGQQCSNGAFPEALSTPGCTPSVDATAFAVQALHVVRGAKAEAAAVRAGRWLAQVQNRDGSFTSNKSRNTNTTGLAAQALRAIGRAQAAARAEAFLRSLQSGCGAAAANRGRVRYDKAGSGDAVRATAQAVPALARVTLADISRTGATRSLPTLAC